MRVIDWIDWIVLKIESACFRYRCWREPELIDSTWYNPAYQKDRT